MTRANHDKSALTDLHKLACSLERELVDRYGLMLGGNDLSVALGFKTQAAFRQAMVRKTVAVPVFSIPRRKGKFALSRDVASWIAKQRQSFTANPDE